MTNTEKLLALGAYSCAGDLIWKNKVMGQLRDGDLVLTEEGKAALAMDVTDVEVKSETKRKAKPKAEPAPLDLDDILEAE